jgi:hypothetical protein
MRLQVCSLQCDITIDPFCSPLATFRLRLADRVLSQLETMTAVPAGLGIADCKPSGPGYVWEASMLTAGNSTAEHSCNTFTITLPSPSPLTLSDICEQNVQLETGPNLDTSMPGCL